MLRKWYKQAKTKYELLTICISNILYYQYMDLFSHVFHMFFSYLITEIVILECLCCIEIVLVQVSKKINGGV